MTIQEIITLSIFPVFSVFYLGEKFKCNHGMGFAFIVAEFFIFHKWREVAAAIQSTRPGGQTSTSCLRAKCKSGGGSSAIPSGSAMVLCPSSA
jgi:hypothetical protein